MVSCRNWIRYRHGRWTWSWAPTCCSACTWLDEVMIAMRQPLSMTPIQDGDTILGRLVSQTALSARSQKSQERCFSQDLLWIINNRLELKTILEKIMRDNRIGIWMFFELWPKLWGLVGTRRITKTRQRFDHLIPSYLFLGVPDLPRIEAPRGRRSGCTLCCEGCFVAVAWWEHGIWFWEIQYYFGWSSRWWCLFTSMLVRIKIVVPCWSCFINMSCLVLLQSIPTTSSSAWLWRFRGNDISPEEEDKKVQILRVAKPGAVDSNGVAVDNLKRCPEVDREVLCNA